MQRILVPTDFSNNAYSALFYATRLFQNQACHFYILHAFDVDTPILTSRLDTEKGELLYKKLSAKSQEGLTEILHAIVRDTEDLNHTFETISVSKNLEETVDKTVKSKKIDLVVMGTKGATGAKEIFMGSNTVKIIQKHTNCPVLAIPNEFDFRKLEEISFVTDFKHFYAEEELEPLMEMASLFKSNIKIMHIHEEEKLDETQEYNYTMLKKYLHSFKHSMHWVPKSNKKSKLINDFIEKMNVDMLVMVNYKHSMVARITHEPVVKKIGFHLSVPFLVIPDAS